MQINKKIKVSTLLLIMIGLYSANVSADVKIEQTYNLNGVSEEEAQEMVENNFMPIEPVITTAGSTVKDANARDQLTEDELDEIDLKDNIFRTIQEIHSLKIAVREMYLDTEATYQKEPYKGLDTTQALKKKIVPITMLSPQPRTVSELENPTDPWGFTIVNRFGGSVLIESVGDKFEHKYFKITYSGLPQIVCEGLILAKWEDSFLGTMWVGVNGNFYSWDRKFSENPLPVTPEEAFAICSEGGYFQVGFK